MSQIPKLSEISADRKNNLNLIRMVAASAVLISHAYPITLGFQAVEPLESHIGMTLGEIAVGIFFILSGFLVSMSFARSKSLSDFFMARAVRIFPALLVVLVLTLLILGPLVTQLPLEAYFLSSDTLTYVPSNLSLAIMQYDLPGVFSRNPVGMAINGSLWTLFYEVTCYFGVALIGFLGAFRSRKIFLAALVAFLIFYIAANLFEHMLSRRIVLLADLGFPFIVGIFFFYYRERIPVMFSASLILFAASTLFIDTFIFNEVFYLTIGYFLLNIGFLRSLRFDQYNRLGDYSYGVYIYAFPMQQLAIHYFGPMTPQMNMIIAFPITLIFAILSWHLVENRALSLKKRFHVRKAAT
ncbi:MAG: acyltransferase [Haliea sp.]